MRSLPYKQVISSYAFYNKTQCLSLRILPPKLEASPSEYKIIQKGSIRLEFMNCSDHPTMLGRKKLNLDSKLDGYLHETQVAEILMTGCTLLEFTNYNQTKTKLEVMNQGLEWNLQRNNDKRTVILNLADKQLVTRILTDSVQITQGWYTLGDYRLASQVLNTFTKK